MSDEPKSAEGMTSIVIQMNDADAHRFVELWQKANSCESTCKLVQVDACTLNEYQQRIFGAFARHCPDKLYTGNAVDVDTLMAAIEGRLSYVDPTLPTLEVAAETWFKCYGDAAGGARTRWHITRDYREEDRLWDTLARTPRFLERAEEIMARRHELKMATHKAALSGSQGKRVDVLLELAEEEGRRLKGIQGHDEETQV